ncbi:MAG TPA: M28 family peptidase, partial [Pyrinomonadaceae bacterium]|nr:M28 family peptidase [Pyrinomonadaceae bacterium]
IKLYSLVILIALSVSLPAALAQRKPAHSKSAGMAATAAGRGVDTISAEQLRTYLSFIASDEMEGRDTPSRGLDTVAKFIALNLSRWGFKPAGDDGTFMQKIALRREQIDSAKTIAEINGQKFTVGDDFLPNTVAATMTGPLIYVGRGWIVQSKNIDDYKGLDVKGKIMVVLSQPPPATQAELRAAQPGTVVSPATYAQTHGAKGLITIFTSGVGQPWDVQRQRALQSGRAVVEKFQQQTTTAAPAALALPSVVIGSKMATALFAGEKSDLATITARAATEPVASFDFSTNKNVNVTVATAPSRLMTQNVVAVWEGGDPKLKDEYVAVGAHYDHIGMAGVGQCQAIGTDTICNGADDDGSGTTAVFGMAEALSHAKLRPKRSVLFVWHCGEEKGLWGSRYFTDYPTVPLDHVVTQLNIDMIGRSKKEGDTDPRNASLSGPNEIYVIGSTMMSTELGKLSQDVNSGYLKIGYDVKYDDPKDPNRFFFRSDHYNYARKGIPIIFFFDGVHEDYHRAGDEPQKIDYEKMEKVTRTIYMTLWEVANLATRPKVDKPLPAQLNQGRGE